VTTDARIEAQGKPSIRLWALNKTQDTKGNFLAVSYFKDTGATGTGEYSPPASTTPAMQVRSPLPTTQCSLFTRVRVPIAPRVTRAVPSSKPPGA